MTYPRVSPAGGWAVGAKLTSAQQNQLDIDHSTSLNGTGDTATGNIHLSSSARIWADFVETIVGNATDSIQAIVARGISSYAAGGIQPMTSQGIVSGVAQGIYATVANAIVGAATNAIAPAVPGGISDGGIIGGVQPTIANGFLSNVANGIVGNIANGIAAGVLAGITDGGLQGGISATTPGGIHLLRNVFIPSGSTYTVDSRSGILDEIIYTNPATSTAITLPASPAFGRSLKLVFPTVLASGLAGAGGSINSNGNAIRLSGVVSGSAGTYSASPATNNNLVYELIYTTVGWLQVG